MPAHPGLKQCDAADKRGAPFGTHEGSGPGRSAGAIARLRRGDGRSPPPRDRSEQLHFL